MSQHDFAFRNLLCTIRRYTEEYGDEMSASCFSGMAAAHGLDPFGFTTKELQAIVDLVSVEPD